MQRDISIRVGKQRKQRNGQKRRKRGRKNGVRECKERQEAESCIKERQEDGQRHPTNRGVQGAFESLETERERERENEREGEDEKEREMEEARKKKARGRRRMEERKTVNVQLCTQLHTLHTAHSGRCTLHSARCRARARARLVDGALSESRQSEERDVRLLAGAALTLAYFALIASSQTAPLGPFPGHRSSSNADAEPRWLARSRPASLVDPLEMTK